MRPIVTLTTDFGSSDAFVGAMKGVLLTRCPDLQIVDITHEVRPQAVRQGALRLASAAPYFPPGTVHLAVIDPGVGGARRAIAVEAGSHFFVGPDNGMLTLAAPRRASAWRAVELTNPAHRLLRVSNTFHGRDVFAPAAAHLAGGGKLDDLGPPVDAVVELRLPHTVRQGLLIRGQVLDVDRFGNIITNVYAADLAGQSVEQVSVGECKIEGLQTSYDDSHRVVAVIDSDDRLEIAVPGGSAFAEYSIGLDDSVEVRLRPLA